MAFLQQHLRIHVRVQGVGFRWSMAQEARRLGVHGWVRNRHDGSVEAMAGGTPEAVTALGRWAQHGPDGARVDRVQVEDVQPTQPLPAEFAQWPSA